ncbi:S1C family serine protease [Croceicoccus sediminis]|uniref:S1C family serine protease n=1 Tax=Croceicoccus sediminis TaxID=2571150 RepID=UPI001F0E287C|nr:serine protease [Croceicoccus sediminis]
MGSRFPLPAKALQAFRLVLCALLLACSMQMAAPAPARADSADINAAARSVVRVVIVLRDSSGYDVIGHGTGFAVTPKLIVTNAHVLAPLLEDDRLRLGVVPAQGRTGYFARIVRVSSDVDLALIELTEDASLPVATLYTGVVEDGADVFAVGYPANVDEALGLGLNGLVSPQAPVKSRGQVSGGRTSTQFDTLLHTAPIGTGNSGGPLLDACGRVVGVNSFGTISDNGSDSEFYFAVSMRELAPFLRKAGVSVHTTALPCQSLAAFDADESARALRESAAQQARLEAVAAERRLKAERASRRAELETIDNRETLMALSGLMLALMVLSAAVSMRFYARQEQEQGAASAIFALLCLVGALAAWFSRPSVDDIVERAAQAERAAMAEVPDVTPPDSLVDKGRFVCRFRPERSRVTVSATNEVRLDWSPDGCVNEQTQFGLMDGDWTRIQINGADQTISVNRYNPQGRVYTVDRYLVDLPTMDAARKARADFQAPACGAGDDAAREWGDAQQSIRALLPKMPNERLVFSCDPAPAGSAATATTTGESASPEG